MSILNVNQLQPVGGGNTITVGSSNIDYSGSVTGNISIDGNLTVAGVLTYDDVTNIDSVGLVTARNGLQVTGGNVGINKASPSRYLEIGGTSNNPQIRLSNVSGTSSLEVLGNAASGQEIRFGTEASPQAGRIIYHNSDDSLRYSNTGGERFRIRSDGRIAIGTQTINTDSMLSIHRSSSDQSQVRFTNTTTGEGGNNGLIVGIDNNEHGRIFNLENHPLRFGTNNTERLRISSGGYVGINEINPTQQLSVHNDTNYEGILINGNSAPRITFARSTSTTVEWGVGIDGTNGNNFAIAQAGNTAKLIIDPSGNIGISDVTPENALTIKNIGSFEGDANSFYLGSNFTGTGQNFTGSGKHAQRFFFNNASSNGYLKYENTGATGNAGDAITWQERFRITSAGQMGLGTNDPTSYGGSVKLAVANTSGTCGLSIVSATNGDGNLYYADGTSGDATYRGYIRYNHTLDQLRIGVAGAERLRVDDDGRVLVGPGAIATPKCGHAGIDIPNNDWAIIMGGSDGNGNRANNANKDARFAGAHYVNAEEPVGIIRYVSGASENTIYMGGGTSLVNAATQLSFYTAANTTTTGGYERLRITSGGAVRIGDSLNANAAGRFQVVDERNTGGDNDCNAYFETNRQDWNIKTYYNRAGTHYHIVFVEQGTERGGIYGSDGSNVNYHQGSDYRWKENIVEMTGTEGIEICKRLKPSKYNWIANREATGEINTVDGFIAHEVEEAGVLGAVSGEKDAVNEDGSIKGQQLDYGQMTPVLAAAIKGLIAKVETLEAQVTALQG